jgi:hypothetical protein
MLRHVTDVTGYQIYTSQTQRAVWLLHDGNFIILGHFRILNQLEDCLAVSDVENTEHQVHYSGFQELKFGMTIPTYTIEILQSSEYIQSLMRSLFRTPPHSI